MGMFPQDTLLIAPVADRVGISIFPSQLCLQWATLRSAVWQLYLSIFPKTILFSMFFLTSDKENPDISAFFPGLTDATESGGPSRRLEKREEHQNGTLLGKDALRKQRSVP